MSDKRLTNKTESTLEPLTKKLCDSQLAALMEVTKYRNLLSKKFILILSKDFL